MVLTTDTLKSLKEGLWYTQVDTTMDPNGKIRGQFVYPGETIYVANLLPGSEAPPVGSEASGGFQFIVTAPSLGVQTARYDGFLSGIAGTMMPTVVLLDLSAGVESPPATTPLCAGDSQYVRVQLVSPRTVSELERHLRLLRLSGLADERQRFGAGVHGCQSERRTPGQSVSALLSGEGRGLVRAESLNGEVSTCRLIS